jgi:hypothetical protein
VNLTAIWRSVLSACELIHIFVRKEKAVIIMLKILGATIQNLVAWATWCPGFVHLWNIRTQVIYDFSQSLRANALAVP